MKRVIIGIIVVIAIIVICVFAFGNNNQGETNKREVLRVGMECAYAPYNWSQPDDSNGAVQIKDSMSYAYGYDVMMAKIMAESLNRDLEIYQIDWDSLPIALQSDKIDCVIAGQSITSERLETVDFTTPYYYASIVTLVNTDGKYADAKGVSDLSGATCTSQINTVWYDTCLPQIENANILPAMETAPNMLVALNSNTVDLVVTDMPTALAAVQVYPNMKILDFTENSEDNYEVSEEEINIGISVKKGNTELLNELNNVLANYTKEDFENMMNEAIKVQPLSE
jgi:putative lysine transport system substrate-binding protein